MITDEMVKAALKAEEEYHASNDISYTSEGMRRALSAALAAMPQEPVAWRTMDSAPKGHPSMDVGCRDVSEWFLGKPADKYRGVGVSPFVVIRRRAWPQDDSWEDNGETYYRPDYFEGWRPLDSALASPATAPAVKALIWNDGGFGYLGGPTWVSDTIVGKYLVEQYGEWAVYFNGALLSGKHPTLKDAQAAGQAHFNDAIRSCLTGAATAPRPMEDLGNGQWVDVDPASLAAPSEEDDMRVAREAAAQVMEEHGEGPAIWCMVQSALIALRNARAKGAA